MGRAPAVLTTKMASAHFAFDPRISSAGRRTRSVRAAILRTPSIVAAPMISLRERGLNSFQRFGAMFSILVTAAPGGFAAILGEPSYVPECGTAPPPIGALTAVCGGASRWF